MKFLSKQRSDLWNPWKELQEMHHRLDRLFTGSAGAAGGEGMTLSEWEPLVDVIEEEKEYLVKAEIPEVKPEDVEVSVDNGILTIRGRREAQKEEKNRKYHRIERSYGSFVRRFSVPDDVDASTVKAKFAGGVLTVRLPKSEAKKPSAVSVAVE